MRPSLTIALGRRRDRPGDGDHPGGQAEQLEHGHDVTAPLRAARHDLVEQIDGGEAQRGGAAPAQHGDVRHGEGADDDEQPQPLRFEKRHWVPLRGCERVSASERAANSGLRGRGTP